MTDEAESNRSEQATPYKLSKAREKGAVARGTDLAFLTGLAGCVAYLWMVGGGWLSTLELASAHALALAPSVVSGADALLALTGAVLGVGVRVLGWMAAIVFGVVLVFEVIQTGPVFTTETLKPDFNRLNPAQNLRRMVSVRLLIHAAKNLLKMIAYVAIAALTIRYAVVSRSSAIIDARTLAAALAEMALRLLVAFIAAAAVFAILDQLLSRASSAGACACPVARCGARRASGKASPA